MAVIGGEAYLVSTWLLGLEDVNVRKLRVLVQKSKSWAERASKGCSFALTNVKRKDNGSAEPVTFTLNFRQALSSQFEDS